MAESLVIKYMQYKYVEFKLKKEKDSYCVLNNDMVIKINYFCKYDEQIYVVGQHFQIYEDFYTYPHPSSMLHVFLVSQLSNKKRWPVEEIKTKCFISI